MLPKAVLSFLGRVMAIAVVGFPFAASAAEATSEDAKPSVHRSHHGKSQKHAKRGVRTIETSEGKSDKTDKVEKIEKAEKSDKLDHADKLQHVAKDAPPVEEVTVEKTSAKPPRQSSTPLPCIAASATKPMAERVVAKEPIAKEPGAKEHAAKESVARDHSAKEPKESKEAKAPAPRESSSKESRPHQTGRKFVYLDHGVEPKRTPVVFTTHERSEKSDKSADSAKSDPKSEKGAKTLAAKSECLHAPVGVTRDSEERWFPLTKCDGTAAPLAIASMSILARPENAAKPEGSIADLGKKSGEELAPGIKRIDARIVERLQKVVDHFAKEDKAPAKITVVSGSRPASKGSFHAMGRAVDFRMEGVENTDLVAFCKTLPDTGCGYYPNSSFIHLDVRDSGTGHVTWIDASTSGEKPQYVASWPPPPSPDKDDPTSKLLSKLDELQLLPSSEPGAEDTKEEAVQPDKGEPAASVAREREE